MSNAQGWERFNDKLALNKDEFESIEPYSTDTALYADLSQIANAEAVYDALNGKGSFIAMIYESGRFKHAEQE